ncbi:MAG: RagB/SusD family nutrient uptake outer membrane protein [Bacteroidales bacterium]|nr:RagB/SusD family nutrient uptake outer membrane protein [Bacteroidales bacterium]
MKKQLYLFFTLVAAVSCLKEDPSQYLSPDGFCKTIEQCDAAVASAYTNLNGVYSYTFDIAMEGCTDLYFIMSDTQDSKMDISPANARFGNTMWEYAYAGIRNCNYALWGMANSGLPADQLKGLVAEATIMRAFWYYLLTSFFGDVPFYEFYVQNLEQLETVRKMPRMSAVETRATLIAELKACIPDLPQQRRCDVSAGGDQTLQRAGAAMGWMLLGKLAMWNKDWDSAIFALEKVETMYGELTEANYPISDIPYSVKNTPESIFEVQHTYSPSGLKVYSSLAMIAMPYPKSSDDEGHAFYNGVSIPEIGDNAVVWQPLRPNSFLSNGLYVKNGNDRRMPMTLVWSWNGKNFSRCWSGPKFWCSGMYNTYDSNNYTIFRYADAVLMLAECYNEAGRSDEAIAHLNWVKNRAGITPYGAFRTKEKLLEEIQNERARELCGEFQRKFDLVRWGIWFQRTYEYTDYDLLKNNLRPCHEYYPIPDTQVALSGGALDNKAYEEGL